jgi:hypothetical protein
MNVVQNFMKALGLGPDDLLKKLRQFNDWVTTHIPEISDAITRYFLPVWRDVEKIMTDVGHLVYDLATLFDNLVGLISGDATVKGAANFDKFAHSVSIVVNWVGKLTDFLVKITGLLAGTIVGGTVGGLIGAIIGGIAGIPGGPLGVAAGIVSGGATGTVVGAGVGAVSGGAFDLYRHFKMDNKDLPSSPQTITGMPNVPTLSGQPDVYGVGAATSTGQRRGDLAAQAYQLANQVSAKTGISAELLWDQWAHETGGFKHIAADNNLAGIRIPGTTEYQTFKSLDDFGDRFSNILKEHRYAGIDNAKDIASYAHQLKLGGYYEDSEKNYAAGMARFDKSYPGATSAQASSMTIGTVTIQITQRPGESQQALANRTVAALRETADKQVQRNLQAQSAMSSYYGG